MDIGAYQYVNLHPPEVTGVTETPTQGATPVNFYTVGGISGVNQTPWTINITFNGPIAPSTLNANTVTLVDLGSNPSQPLDQDINLSGKLTYDSATDTLVINLAAAGLTLGTDAYQITLFGSGSPVITNPQGVASGRREHGRRQPDRAPTGASLGQRLPGRQLLRLVHHQHHAARGPGRLAHAGPGQRHQHRRRQHHHRRRLPTFDGTVSEPNPTLVPVAGQTAILDIGIAVLVNGVLTTYFTHGRRPRQPATSSSARTRAPRPPTTGGAFQVTVGVDGANTGLVTNTNPLPNLFGTYNVGAERRTCRPCPATDSGYYVARVRDHRPERQPVQSHRSQRPGAVRRRYHAPDGHRSRRPRPAR